MKARIQKIIAESGLCSRRKAEALIIGGRVKMNGRPARLGQSADPDLDRIEVDGRPLEIERKAYFLLNKPPGYECSLRSTTGKPLATDLVNSGVRLFPVGRLDVDSRGLLILTNDGDFANSLIHPSKSPEKEYHVITDKAVSPEDLRLLSSGIIIDGKKTKPCQVTQSLIGKKRTLVFIIHEGRKRQIRRMLAFLGLKVKDIQRVRIGQITLKGIPEGQSRRMREDEISSVIAPEDGKN